MRSNSCYKTYLHPQKNQFEKTGNSNNLLPLKW